MNYRMLGELACDTGWIVEQFLPTVVGRLIDRAAGWGHVEPSKLVPATEPVEVAHGCCP